MKKIVLLVLVMVAAAMLLVGCSGGTTPATSWADEETLVYNITDTKSGEGKGTMTVVTVRRPADKTLAGETYDAADGKVTIDIDMPGTCIVHTEMLTQRYTVIATYKKYTDLTGEGSYELKAHHSGKNYFYTLNGGDEKKLKTGNSYTDSDYIYHFIRSYPISSPPSSIKVADPLHNTVNTVGCSVYAKTVINVPYPDGSKDVECTAIAITLSSAPQGKSITVCFTPDAEGYYMEGLSISASKKMPVEIIENDLTYKISSMSVK